MSQKVAELKNYKISERRFSNSSQLILSLLFQYFWAIGSRVVLNFCLCPSRSLFHTLHMFFKLNA